MCVCVFILIYSYGCFFLLPTSCQTLGFTRAWPPAPAVKHRGALSWKSKVRRGFMIARMRVKGLLSCVSSMIETRFLRSIQNQVAWWSWKTTMRTSFPARRPNLRSPMSPRTVCRYPGSPAWLEHHLYPLLSSRRLGWFQQRHQWHL